jgi:hypothetical protein
MHHRHSDSARMATALLGNALIAAPALRFAFGIGDVANFSSRLPGLASSAASSISSSVLPALPLSRMRKAASTAA